jgi:hypothetical protein
MKKILFVPQTARNMSILVPYANALKNNFDILFIRNTLWGTGCDIATSQSSHSFTVIEPPFLLQTTDKLSEFGRILLLRSLHYKYIEFLEDLKPDLIVIGQDGNGFGYWTTVLANKLKIPTLACQEGCRGINRSWVGPHEYPLFVSLKIILFRLLVFYIYKPGCFKEDINDFLTAKYAATWGSFMKKELIRRGKNETTIFVVGDPRIPSAETLPANGNLNASHKTLVFFDVATYSFPHSRGNYRRFMEFRKTLIHVSAKLGYRLIYKTHPFTAKNELADIGSLLITNVTLITSGLGEDLIAQSHACISFPSTILFTILALKVPLIQVHLHARAYGKILWDPVKLHNAGVTIQTGDDLKKALQTISKPGWIEKYRLACPKASEEMVGPLDGKAPSRFADAINSILLTHTAQRI